MTEYSATVTREGPWWIADVEDVGVTQGRNLGELHRMAVDLVVSMLEVRPRDVSIKFNVEIPRVTPKIKAARLAMKLALEAQEAAALQSRQLVTEMRSMGMSVGDVAQVLEVSPQRVSQLSAHGRPRNAAAGKRTARDSTGKTSGSRRQKV
jgi:hypothetical protein